MPQSTELPYLIALDVSSYTIGPKSLVEDDTRVAYLLSDHMKQFPKGLATIKYAIIINYVIRLKTESLTMLLTSVYALTTL